MTHTATYSPDDNKIRITPAHRLGADEYARVKAAGYVWAQKQELFVAPMWTPASADLAIEMCGEIDDEDSTLAERADARADRFSEYSERRAADADTARAGVERIAGGIPFGQPILIGHHSERHARKDAERIQSGMRRAVSMWETAGYWKSRAAGAIRNAAHKERSDVRARRIKGLEADQRKQQKSRDESAAAVARWAKMVAAGGLALKSGGRLSLRDSALYISGHESVNDAQCFPLADFPRDPPASQYEGMMSVYSALTGGVITAEQAAEIAPRAYTESIAWADRWLVHLAGRLEYERAMLADAGGLAAAGFDLQPGGMITARYGWQVVIRVNRSGGEVLSVTVAGQSWTIGVEEITDYRPPTESAAAAVAAAVKLAPLVNYPVDGCATMTQAEYTTTYKDSKSTATRKATETHGAHRLRYVAGFLGRKHGATGCTDQWSSVPVFISDAKRTEAPSLTAAAPKVARKAAPVAIEAPASAPVATLREVMIEAPAARQLERTAAAAAAPFDAMREALRTGSAVTVVVAPQLFPTPADLAARMADLAGPLEGARVLEPSAGTGALLLALGGRPVDARTQVHAVEVNPSLAKRLRVEFPLASVHCQDFLEIAPLTVYPFNAILMNPPFAKAADIAHILHARRFLAPGGRLVAICAGGPRQAAALQHLCEHWEPLPPGTFKEQGTGVNTVLLMMRRSATA